MFYRERGAFPACEVGVCEMVNGSFSVVISWHAVYESLRVGWGG